MKVRTAIGALLALPLLVGACGDDDGGDGTTPTTGGGGGGSTLEVIARDIEFDRDDYAAQAGTIDVVYRNEGVLVHSLMIEDVEGFRLEVESTGDEDTGTVELDPGSYTLFCDIPGHRAAGMEATLEVSG